jgi:hypothetical protein
VRNSRVLEVGTAILALAVVFAVSRAGASGIAAPQAPEVFSRDFGIVLARNHADGANSALGDIDSIANYRFPWTGGFGFPETPPEFLERTAPTESPGQW